MKKLLSLTMLLFLFETTASADVVLSTNHNTGAPVMMTGGDATSTTMTVSIDSDVSDPLAGWSVLLEIVPLGGSTGSVQFNSAAVAPVNYVFGTPQSFFNTNIAAGNLSLTSLDANIPSGGGPPTFVPVLSPPGFNLLDLDFSASSDASGTFGVFAYGGVGNSEWTDPGFSANPFSNVGGAGQTDQIGEIFVTVVPEPAGLGLTFVAALCAMLGCQNNRRYH